MIRKNYPTQEELQEKFYYKDGHLYKKYNDKKFGSIDGSYYSGSFNNRKIKVHCLIWIYHNGEIPCGMIVDHVNGLSTDNRIENLAIKTLSENRLSARYKDKGYYKTKDNMYKLSFTDKNGKRVRKVVKTEEEAILQVKQYREEKNIVYHKPTIEQFIDHLNIIIKKEIQRYLHGNQRD